MAFYSFITSLFPAVKAQDDIVNPQDVLKEKCGEIPKVKALFDKYQTCQDRVNSRSSTSETCAEELFDYMDALNTCVGSSLFSKLK